MPEPCQYRRPWRQDIRTIDLVDTARFDRADPLPPGPLPDGLHVHGLAAPRGEDDLGVSSGDLARIHDPVPSRGLVPELREDVAPAGDLDDLGYPADSGDQRVVPLLEVDSGPVGPDGGELSQLPD